MRHVVRLLLLATVAATACAHSSSDASARQVFISPVQQCVDNWILAAVPEEGVYSGIEGVYGPDKRLLFIVLHEGLLVVFHCDDPTCKRRQRTIVGHGVENGAFTVWGDSRNAPVISYRRASDHGLSLVDCKDPACSVRYETHISEVPYRSWMALRQGTDLVVVGSGEKDVCGVSELFVSRCVRGDCSNTSVQILSRNIKADKYSVAAKGALLAVAYVDEASKPTVLRCNSIGSCRPVGSSPANSERVESIAIAMRPSGALLMGTVSREGSPESSRESRLNVATCDSFGCIPIRSRLISDADILRIDVLANGKPAGIVRTPSGEFCVFACSDMRCRDLKIEEVPEVGGSAVLADDGSIHLLRLSFPEVWWRLCSGGSCSDAKLPFQ
jgi:hypothetical protein